MPLPTPQTESALFRAAQHRETQRLHAQHRRDAVSEAHGAILAFVRSRWAEHLWPSIRVAGGDLTAAQLRDLGRLRRDDGVRACAALIRAPAIGHEVAVALWEHLRAEVGEEGMGAQEGFEREVVAAVVEEEECGMDWQQVAGGGAGGAPRCVFCAAGGVGARQACRLPEEVREGYRGRSDRWEEGFWQTEELVCPCQKVVECASGEETSTARGPQSSDEREMLSPYTTFAASIGDSSSSPSIGGSSLASSMSSRISRVFVWGR